MHKFPTEEKILRQWLSFCRQKADSDSWKGSGHICWGHFTPEDYHDYGMKVAGCSSYSTSAASKSVHFTSQFYFFFPPFY